MLVDHSEMSNEGIVEYCQTQARLLYGRAERLRDDIDDRLGEIEAEAAAVRGRLQRERAGVDRTQGPTTPTDTVEAASTLASLEAQQATIAGEQDGLTAIEDCADGYLALGERLADENQDSAEAIEAVLRFEADASAPLYFDDRTTLLETAQNR